MTLSQDIANYLAYVQGSPIPPETIALALQYKESQETVSGNIGGGSSYSIGNYSGVIYAPDVAQDLLTTQGNRDRLTIQNLDSTDVLLVGIDEDAVPGRSYEIEPRGLGILEEGEADKRISVLSAKAGLQFVAIARFKY